MSCYHSSTIYCRLPHILYTKSPGVESWCVKQHVGSKLALTARRRRKLLSVVAQWNIYRLKLLSVHVLATFITLMVGLLELFIHHSRVSSHPQVVLLNTTVNSKIRWAFAFLCFQWEIYTSATHRTKWRTIQHICSMCAVSEAQNILRVPNRPDILKRSERTEKFNPSGGGCGQRVTFSWKSHEPVKCRVCTRFEQKWKGSRPSKRTKTASGAAKRHQAVTVHVHLAMAWTYLKVRSMPSLHLIIKQSVSWR